LAVLLGGVGVGHRNRLWARFRCRCELRKES